MKILLADDHPLFREGVKPVLHKLDRKVELVEAVDYPSAFEAMHRAGEVDLALLDLYMPGMAGLDGVARFRVAFPEIPVVVLSAAEERDDIQTLLAAGALGYITKSSPSDVILAALRVVLSGGVYLPPSMADQYDGERRRYRIFPNIPRSPRARSRSCANWRKAAATNRSAKPWT